MSEEDIEEQVEEAYMAGEEGFWNAVRESLPDVQASDGCTSPELEELMKDEIRVFIENNS